MLENGFLEEVVRLMEMGYGRGLKPMQSLGYKHMVQFALKEIGWDEAVGQMKRDTRHYARRQWTWFKADPEVRWWDESTDRREIILKIKSFWGRGGPPA
jgi:tRNA dimethylallyltransferase